MTPTIRTMPQDRVSEETILSAILTSGAEAMDLCDSLTPSHFYTRGNRIIYEACVAVFAEVPTVETMSVISKLKSRGQLEEVGGIHRVNEIASAFMSTGREGAEGGGMSAEPGKAERGEVGATVAPPATDRMPKGECEYPVALDPVRGELFRLRRIRSDKGKPRPGRRRRVLRKIWKLVKELR